MEWLSLSSGETRIPTGHQSPESVPSHDSSPLPRIVMMLMVAVPVVPFPLKHRGYGRSFKDYIDRSTHSTHLELLDTKKWGAKLQI